MPKHYKWRLQGTATKPIVYIAQVFNREKDPVSDEWCYAFLTEEQLSLVKELVEECWDFLPQWYYPDIKRHFSIRKMSQEDVLYSIVLNEL